MDINFTEMERRFEEDGYYVLRGLIDPKLLSELKSWLSGHADEARAVAQAARLKQPELLTANEKALISGNFPQAAKGDLYLWEALLSSPSLHAALQSVLRSQRIYGHMYPSPRYIDPGNDVAGVPAHIDRQYNDHMTHFITVWLPIECFSSEFGGVIVYPRSHKAVRAWEETKKQASGFWFEPLPEPENGELQVLAPGDVLLIHPDLLHKSALNKSQQTRLSCDFRVFGDDAFTKKHYLEFHTRKILEPYQGERHAEKV